MNNLAIIPARSGSKGLKDKNIKLLCGKPLLAYTITSALESGMFDTIMVSTDSEKYASIARQYGAVVPFLRDERYSGDSASSWDAVREVLTNFQECGTTFDTFALLQPTTPLRNAYDIINGYRLLEEEKCSAVVAVCETEHSPSLVNTLPQDHSFSRFLREPEKYCRQMNEKTYRLNGAIYISKVTHFNSTKYIYDSDCYAMIMPRHRSVDIDNELDFLIAETILKNIKTLENSGNE